MRRRGRLDASKAGIRECRHKTVVTLVAAMLLLLLSFVPADAAVVVVGIAIVAVNCIRVVIVVAGCGGRS